MPQKKKRQSKDEIIEEAELTERVALLCPRLNFDGYVVEVAAFGLHPSFAMDSSLSHHLHSHIEIHVVFSGNGIATVEQDSYSFGPGQFVVNIPEKIHYWQTDKKALSMLVMGIRVPEPKDYQASESQRLFKNLLEAQNVVYTTPGSFENLYRTIVNELEDRKIGYVNAIGSLLKLMILDLARNTVSEKSANSHIPLPVTTPFRADRIVVAVNDFIKHNIGEKINLEALAGMLYISKRTLTRHYRQACGKTIGERINELRMAHAEELVRETKLLAKTIAANCGYHNKSHFSKDFRNRFGCTPMEYRKLIKDVYE